MALRIIIADDHPMLIDGLVNVLREIEDLDIPASVGNGRQLLDVLSESGAEMVMLDLNMPKMDGIDTLRRVKKDFPQVRVIVFTSYNQPKLIADVRALGADGYLLGSPVNLGYLSGALKHFFDQIYYPCLDATRRRPFGVYLHADNDATGALRALDSITAGLGWDMWDIRPAG